MSFLSAVSVRLTKLTGKSKYPLHPKHLLRENVPWYFPHFNKNDNVLDLGCGDGQQTIKAAGKVKYIIGVESQERLLKIAQDSSRDSDVKNILFRKGNIEKGLDFQSNVFDKILFLDVLEHLYRREFALSEARRVLKKGGLLLLAVPNKGTTWKRQQKAVGISYFSDPDHKTEFSKEQVVRLCRRVRLEPLAVQTITYDTPLAPLIDFIGGFSLSLYSRLQRWKRQMVLDHPEETIGFRLVCRK